MQARALCSSWQQLCGGLKGLLSHVVEEYQAVLCPLGPGASRAACGGVQSVSWLEGVMFVPPTHPAPIPLLLSSPETMYGQTNCWTLPEGDYAAFRGLDDEIYIMTERSALNLSYQVHCTAARVVCVGGVWAGGAPPRLGQALQMACPDVRGVGMGRGMSLDGSLPGGAAGPHARDGQAGEAAGPEGQRPAGPAGQGKLVLPPTCPTLGCADSLARFGIDPGAFCFNGCCMPHARWCLAMPPSRCSPPAHPTSTSTCCPC